MEGILLGFSIASFALGAGSLVACAILFFRADVPDAIRFLQHKPMKGRPGTDKRPKRKRSGTPAAVRPAKAVEGSQGLSKRTTAPTGDVVERKEAEGSEAPTDLLASADGAEKPTDLLAEEGSEAPTGLLDDGGSEAPTSLLSEGAREPSTRQLATDEGGRAASRASDDPRESEPIAGSSVEASGFYFHVRERILSVHTDEVLADWSSPIMPTRGEEASGS